MPSQVPFAAAAAALFTLAQMSDACCWPASVRRCHALPGAELAIAPDLHGAAASVAGGGGEAGGAGAELRLGGDALAWRVASRGGKFGEEVGDG